MQSKYLKTLMQENRDVGERYVLKLKLINDVDPFTINVNDRNSSIQAAPPVTYMDIAAYLVLTHSFYSNDQMKAYKSLDSYKYFESGFVLDAGTVLLNNFHVLIGKVKHSQKGSAKALDVWCIVTKEGSVSTAHCTCMAGNSEVCSHVGAILFAAEYANKKKEEVSCTDTLGTWMMPSTSAKLSLVPVNEMDWGNPSNISIENKTVKPLTDVELDEMLKKMVDLGNQAAIMRIVEPFATDIAKEANPILPSVLNIFNEGHTTLSYMELMKMSKSIDLTITPEQKSLIEKCTRNQAENQSWYTQRAGRITASKFHAACRTKITKPSLSLIKLICYPTKGLFSTKATLWGITKEANAVEAYQKVMEDENHDSFIINKVGFVISQRWSQFGGSPDRLVFCECCLGDVWK